MGDCGFWASGEIVNKWVASFFARIKTFKYDVINAVKTNGESFGGTKVIAGMTERLKAFSSRSGDKMF